MDKSKQLGEMKILKLLIKFSIPAIVGMLVNALYNVVDRIYIGNGVGSLGIAGITIAFPVMLVMMAFSMLIGIGANSLVSIRLGQNRKGCPRYFWQFNKFINFNFFNLKHNRIGSPGTTAKAIRGQ